MDQENLRSFRHKVSLLKKQGLIPSKISPRKKLDARSALPDWKIKGKKLSTLIKKFDDVTSGKASAITPKTPADLKRFRKSGFETASGKVIVPHSANETAKLIKGKLKITNKTGVEHTLIPVEFHNLRQYLRDIRKNAKAINALKGKNEYFGIRFHGGQRAIFFSDIELLLNHLNKYDALKDHDQDDETYAHLEILTINEQARKRLSKELHPSVKRRKRKASRGPKKNRHVYDKLYRQSLTAAQKVRYKKAARARAAKSRKNGKQKKTRKRSRS